ncbi:MAG: hypothetical protein ABSG53_26525, partial [Thermoguttaceae bacterium]
LHAFILRKNSFQKSSPPGSAYEQFLGLSGRDRKSLVCKYLETAANLMFRSTMSAASSFSGGSKVDTLYFEVVRGQILVSNHGRISVKLPRIAPRHR